MNIMRCDFGHFYDGEKNISCPICKKLNGKNENVETILNEDAFCLHWYEEDPVHDLPGIILKSNPGEVSVHIEGIYCPEIKLRFSLKSGEEITLGRSDSADYILNARDKALSRVHCCIKYENECVFIKDLNSMNGTFCHNLRLTPQTYYQLESSEIIRIATYEYIISFF